MALNLAVTVGRALWQPLMRVFGAGTKVARTAKNVKIPKGRVAAPRGTKPGRFKAGQTYGQPRWSDLPASSAGKASKIIKGAVDPKVTGAAVKGTATGGAKLTKEVLKKSLSPLGIAATAGTYWALSGDDDEELAAAEAEEAAEAQKADDGEGGPEKTPEEKLRDRERAAKEKADLLKEQNIKRKIDEDLRIRRKKEEEEARHRKRRSQLYQHYKGGVDQFDEDVETLKESDTPARMRSWGMDYLRTEPERQANIRMRQWGSAEDRRRTQGAASQRAKQMIEGLQQWKRETVPPRQLEILRKKSLRADPGGDPFAQEKAREDYREALAKIAASQGNVLKRSRGK